MSCHGAGASRCNKARSWRHCLANSCVRKHELVGKVAWFVSGLWYSRIWNSCLFWFCQAGNTEWLWTGGFEKNTPGFSDHVTSRPIIQRAVGLYGFLQSSSPFIWSERCLVQDLVWFSHLFFHGFFLVGLLLLDSRKKNQGFRDEANRIVPSVQQLLRIAERDLTTTMLERFRMGPCYSWEIRKELKEVRFSFFFWQKRIQSVQNFYINLV